MNDCLSSLGEKQSYWLKGVLLGGRRGVASNGRVCFTARSGSESWASSGRLAREVALLPAAPSKDR